MSSHHIIRDEQEPPVLVFQLNENWQELSELLGWSPILLINPSLKAFFDLRQTKIDGYLSSNDKDKFSDKDFEFTDSNLVETLVSWTDEKKYTAVNIFCDHKFMADIFLQLRTKDLSIPIVFFTENGKYILKPTSTFKKWYPEKFRIEILNDDINDTKNLKQDGLDYLVEKDGFVRVAIKGKMVLIREK